MTTWGSRPSCYFNSRPHGGRHIRRPFSVAWYYFNSRPHGGRLSGGSFGYVNVKISTHALTEGDEHNIDRDPAIGYFNSRPHGGRLVKFEKGKEHEYFNSRPHGGRLHLWFHVPFVHFISTHALTEGDQELRQKRCSCRVFQLTPSRRATSSHWSSRSRKRISTHALTEGDCLRRTICTHRRHFNSRPHGGRQKEESMTFKDIIFQLTPSRRATRMP